ncbi:MAG TPA: NrfD/PsrC family molybdoenzyme membrane anchor subunit [Thermodesulfobacteriota bacterium]|nr:NrfD/PsrC family molybdoenzyme membrane anchor subunit [Thermodesulfobacteriota bacterium]
MIDHEGTLSKHASLIQPLTRWGKASIFSASILALIVLWSVFAFVWQYIHGLGETGMGHPVSWAFYLVNFVFFIGISHAGALVSAVLRITHARWGTPFGRAAEAVTVFALAAGPTNILFDLGRSIRFYWVALHAQFKSPLLWDFTCIMTYFTVSNIFLIVLMIPDVGLLRDLFPKRRWLYKPLSFGWNWTEGQQRTLGKVIGILCIAVIPIAVSVHTVVSWVFGMQTQPMWHSTIFAPYFVTGAIFSGIATIVIVTIALRRIYHLEEYLTPYHFNNMGLLLLTFTLLWFYFTFAEHLTVGYGGGIEEQAVLWSKLTGRYAPLFWAMVGLCFFIPFPILVLKRTIPWLLLSSISIVIGMWLERFLIIIPSFAEPRLPYARGAYTPSWVEWSLMAGLCAGFSLAFVLFSKLFPVISIWETEKEDKERETDKKIDIHTKRFEI